MSSSSNRTVWVTLNHTTGGVGPGTAAENSIPLWGTRGWVVIVATGATAGKPGSFTPAGAAPPFNLSVMGSVVANPTTAWTTGQYVQTDEAGAAGRVHWDGAAWAAGVAP